MLRKTSIILIAALLWSACAKKTEHRSEKTAASPSTALRYAKGFSISTLGSFTLVEVLYPFQGATEGYKYLLVPRGETPPPHDGDAKVIHVPLESLVCTSTTHIPLLDYIGETDKLTGFPTTDYISSEKMRARIEQGKVVDLGIDNSLNLERLAVLKPDALMGYTMSGDYGQFRKIESLGIPVIINAEYLEHHPLGRAEWIKFMALFFGKEREADSAFQAIENSYLETKASLSATTKTPTAMAGIVYGDAWFLPAGQNYAARLFLDAGYDYLWKETPGNGYLHVPFEAVYEKASQADVWIGTAGYKTLDEIRAADTRYTRFEAYRRQQVYNYDAKHGAKGGNVFLELGYLRPDIILKDLIRIGHPELLPEHELYFYRKLAQSATDGNETQR